MKSISAKMVFREFPDVKKQLYAVELWNNGYLVRYVDNKVTPCVIPCYVNYQPKSSNLLILIVPQLCCGAIYFFG